jgi:phospholipase C
MPHQTLTRRRALASLASMTAALGLAALGPLDASADSPSSSDAYHENGRGLPAPDRSGIEHIVLVMMENRSFDHFLGWLPGHDGRQAGLRYADAAGVLHPTHHLAPDFQGCGFHDPDHSFTGGRVEYDNGHCDGWLRAGSNDLFSIGYYIQEDLPFIGQIAARFATPERYFAAMLGPTFPNRIFQHAGQTDRLSNTATISALPTIWDRLASAGISGRYYFSDIPALALWGAKYLSISRPVASFLTDAAAGTLPAVSFIDPAFAGEATGTSNDDHPFNDIRNGEVFLDTLYSAVTSGPAWRNTIFIINFDEWGGFFDHVPPPPGPITSAERALGYTDGLRGFRVPCLVVSPWSQHTDVPRAVFDHTSILKLIEWRFGLQSLSVRDAEANNLAQMLDFDDPRLDVPRPRVPPGPYGGICAVTPGAAAMPATSSAPNPENEWLPVRDLAAREGWPV